MFTVLEEPQHIACAGAGRQHSTTADQTHAGEHCTVYKDEPQVAPTPPPPLHSFFITWLCLCSPCGLFSD